MPGLALLALASCDVAPETTSTAKTPAIAQPAPASKVLAKPSERSLALKSYYTKLQAQKVAMNLLRTGGGDFDTPYTDTDIIRNFERIVFHDEHARDAGFLPSDGRPDRLKKWQKPIRISAEFGGSVSEGQREKDKAVIKAYANRLARITGHPISASDRNPNFIVMIMGEDDRQTAMARAREVIPSLSAASFELFKDMPRSTECFVISAGHPDDYIYRAALAYIRAETSDRLRRGCIHEEIAQGLGLPNDSPYARPSIFNDDDEFALLTTHDEVLLRLLYNPALTPGMTADQARPIVRRLLADRDETS